MSDKAKKKQTEATLSSVCESLRTGISFARSCSVSGISKQTGFAWRSAGWNAIETEDADSDEPISFVARFALEIEMALADFQRPLIQRIRDGAAGKSKGDWRAAQQLLASRFPDEFSEKVAAAKSGRLEVSGQIAVEHQHSYQAFLNMQNMSMEELNYEVERITSQIENRLIDGEELDGQIALHEDKLASMHKARESGWGWVAANWISSKGPAIKPAVPAAIELDESEYTELLDVSGAATSGLPPDTADGVVLPEAAAPVALRSGIGFDTDTGQAFSLPPDNEDLSL